MALDPRLQRQDAALAAAIGVGTVISAGLGAVAGLYGDRQAPMWAAVAYALVLAAAVAMRRRFPGTVAVVTAAAFFAAGTWHVPELFVGTIAMFIGFYTVGAISPDRRRAAWIRIGITIGMFVWLLTATFVQATSPTDDTLSQAGAFSPFVAYALLNILINALYFAGAYYFGERAWAAAAARRTLEERTAELEHERERTAAQAVALERLRIARELHDVVAHHVSLMGVQAGAARAVMTKDPDAAARTLAQVEASARDALGELRRLLQTLRSDSDTDAPSTVGLAGLADLVAQATDAGLVATLTVIGEPRPAPDTVQVSLYRIAQEALTNARRHAGPGATADVRLRYGARGVELEVTNTGRQVLRPGRGLGLVGMRERAAAVGGLLEARPREQGGFLVRVSVPMRETTDA
ncbi:sensor histidine kinase [Microbacterium luticocti]|uniref:sensor histidine kinase n=1 Tax=Microbacterium luticocti TaxID=451764 RepID=UPI00041A06E7|nr:sensor histidine kinase [Microbacterium luticocti]